MTDRHIVKNTHPLTIEEIQYYAPSALALEPSSDRSTRYAYISTLDVIRGMEKAGFLPFAASQSRTRIEGHQNFTKHMLRFRHASQMEVKAAIGGMVPEAVLINAHDGSSAYKLFLGLFRFVCGNGMVVADSMYGNICIRHSGNAIVEVVQGSNLILEAAPKVISAVETWKGMSLTATEQIDFAIAAHRLRFANSAGQVSTPITPDQLLKPRRAEDMGDDLFSVFNRIQEHVIRGGDRNRPIVDGKLGRRTTSREVKGIDGVLNLNRELWSLAENLAKLKAN